jgi:hypothetical protein
MAQKGDRVLGEGDNPTPRVPDPTKPISASNPPESRGTRVTRDVNSIATDQTQSQQLHNATPLNPQGTEYEGELADSNVADVTNPKGGTQAVSQPTQTAKSPAMQKGGSKTTK